MIDALRQAGFLAVEAEGGTIHARLWSGSVDFTATRAGDQWQLALHWPVRASKAQRESWNASHPHALMDIHQGETRLLMRVPCDSLHALHLWAALAEQAVARLTRWRRMQRQPGEGY
ncbi:MAG: hypothetical protein U0934_10450 [Pseudotabrizicola sp.]|uniref:hypothetical protein n=1 Tax=Pseudotabrizicola sp. TaxID=2939647 RepID=UPI002725AD2A|nr:hypothetical protein [Pseudotabrizicola sp.]MDO8882366.1 hypothetical protein [Pseudotabrizicola sp.]MDP2082309.1 hypothetical protein [Pseudotabrizicola sp.]MDZ7574365.1 hypothetical protein [Pseudotabrizicola sp.]